MFGEGGREGEDKPMMRLYHSDFPSCCDAPPARPRRGSSSSASRRMAASGMPVAEAILIPDQSCRFQ